LDLNRDFAQVWPRKLTPPGVHQPAPSRFSRSTNGGFEPPTRAPLISASLTDYTDGMRAMRGLFVCVVVIAMAIGLARHQTFNALMRDYDHAHMHNGASDEGRTANHHSGCCHAGVGCAAVIVANAFEQPATRSTALPNRAPRVKQRSIPVEERPPRGAVA
jgi:hypothetical protein